MKILSVVIEGFGPFKDAQAIDFTAFDDFGIYLIGGRTGAGKSTILDAICFALYGSVPRYDGYSGTARLRSDHCTADDVTRVTLTFEANGRGYRIVRSPEYERPKSRGTGVTRQPASVELWIRTDHGWECLETKIPELARRVAEIVKLDKGQFLQVMLLAQNRFQEFLDAESKDRQALLRTLFGTQRFEDYAEALHARAQELGEQLSLLSAEAARVVADLAAALEVEPPGDDQDRLAWARSCAAAAVESLGDAQSVEARAVEQARAAGVALSDAQQLADRQGRRSEAQAQLAALERRAAAHQSDSLRLEAAIAAAQVEQQLRVADAAAAALVRARAQETAAGDAAGSVPEPDLNRLVARLGQAIGSLGQALETETGLAAIKQADADASAALATHDDLTASIDARRASLRERLSELTGSERVAATDANDVFAADAQIATTTVAHAAAVQAAALDAEVEQLEQLELAAMRERSAATTDHERLRTAQLHGRAAVLAQALVDGEPCPVCGAREHPQPARFDGQPVTDEQVETARARLEQAHASVDAAARRLADAESRAAERRGAAGGRSVETLVAELAAADRRLETAKAAQTKLESIATQRADIADKQRQLDEAERTAADRRTQLAADAALAAKALADAQELLERSREGHQSVAARVQDLKRRQVALEQLIRARAEVVRAEDADRQAAALLGAQLAQRGFTDRGAAEAMMLPEVERAALAQAIREHEDGLTKFKAVLGQPDLQDLPAEPADLAGAMQRAQAADSARNASTERRVTLEGRAKQARVMTTKLESELQKATDLDAKFKVVDGLAGVVRGDQRYNQPGIPLESFVLAAELEEIVAAANQRLRTMSQGRYSIEHSDERTRGGKRTGLEIVVYDAHTGSARSARSLSGGEKFLASLALALGLAEVVTGRSGGIQLDTLFIDEGFGSLDTETLDVAMQTLDHLRQGGRTVGLISHVEAMKDQIPAQLLVDVGDRGWSLVRKGV